MTDPDVYRRLNELEERLGRLEAADVPVIGSGTAGRVAQWATGGQTLEAATLAKTGAGLVTVAAASAYTLTLASGTFTPVLRGATTAGTFTYSTQSGYWERLGPLVLLALRVTVTAVSVAPVGNLRIIGISALPAPVSETPFSFAATLVNNVDLPASRFDLSGRVITESSELRIEIRDKGDNAAATQYASTLVAANWDLSFQGWYVTAA